MANFSYKASVVTLWTALRRCGDCGCWRQIRPMTAGCECGLSASMEREMALHRQLQLCEFGQSLELGGSCDHTIRSANPISAITKTHVGGDTACGGKRAMQ